MSQGCVECILSHGLCSFIAMLIAQEKKQNTNLERPVKQKNDLTVLIINIIFKW